MLPSLRRGIITLCSRRIYIFMMVIVPLAGAFFFLSLMHEGLPLKIPVSVVDLDHSSMSRRVTRSLNASELIEITDKAESFNDALLKVRSGETYGFFYIPESFQKDALSGRTPTISFFCNMSIFVPGTLSFKGFKTIAVSTSGSLVEATLSSAGLDEVLGGSSVLMPLRLDTHPIGNPCTNYSIYLSPSFLGGLISLLVMVVTVFSVTSEIKWGTSPEWLSTARGSMLRALIGKLLPQTLIFTVMGVGIQAVMFGFLNFPMHSPAWHMILAMLLLVCSSQAYALVAVECVPNMRLALIIVSLSGILAFSIAGFSFPVDKMYGPIAIFAYILPVRWYFLIYIDQALNGIPLYYSRFYYVAMLVTMLVPLLGLKRLKKKCLTPVYVP
ncbi:MAG: ABC transporter permease [Muribaculaceae bacterium]|nr:ABC transporter permease [Muribaculaceae bacterium]